MDNLIKKDKLNIQDIVLFKDKPILLYIYKKTEKLVSAIYMLSNFISDKEPVKWRLRQTGLDLISELSVLSLSDRTSFITGGLELLSLLEISYAGGVISEMNFNILKFEFESLLRTVESVEKSDQSKGLLFPEHFFTSPDPLPSTKMTINPSPISKGQDTVSDRMSFKKLVPDRSEIILGLLKKNKELGIKDFSQSISGCSEKTIQRELASLVAKGLIRKEGEKRWSRYSLR